MQKNKGKKKNPEQEKGKLGIPESEWEAFMKKWKEKNLPKKEE